MGGVRMVPDALLADLDPAVSDLLVLPGAQMWDAGGGDAFAAAAGRFLDAGVPVAAICGATAGLARAGLLDERNHTSATAEYLAATGYAGGDRYVDERAVIDGDLVTAGPQSPVQFARATLGRLGLASGPTLDAYKLLGCTEAGYWTIRRITLVQRPWAARIGAEVGADELQEALTTMGPDSCRNGEGGNPWPQWRRSPQTRPVTAERGVGKDPSEVRLAGLPKYSTRPMDRH